MDLKAFSKKITIIASKFPEETNKAIKKVAIIAQQAIVSATPVDTGLARGNWQVSLNQPQNSVTDETDKIGSTTIAKNINIIKNRVPEEDIWIVNNIHYIIKLNQGSSAQAPAGFVEAGIDAAVREIKNVSIKVS